MVADADAVAEADPASVSVGRSARDAKPLRSPAAVVPAVQVMPTRREGLPVLRNSVSRRQSYKGN